MILLTRGMKGYQIAHELHVDPATISRDLQYMSKQASKNVTSLVKETLPFMYNTSMEGIKNVLLECWNIYASENKEVNWMNKINALKLAKECNEALFKLVAEGPSLAYLKDLEERLERIEKHKKEDP